MQKMKLVEYLKYMKNVNIKIIKINNKEVENSIIRKDEANNEKESRLLLIMQLIKF